MHQYEFENVSKNGKDYVLVPQADFELQKEQLEDADDLRALREARAENEGKPRVSHAEVKRILGLEN